MIKQAKAANYGIRIMSLVMICIMIAGFIMITPGESAADVTQYWNAEMQAYEFLTQKYGIVICTKMNVRDRASTQGKSYGQIKNGQPVKILGVTQNADFYVLDLQSCGFKNVEPGSYGYAKTGLIKIDPEFIIASKMTNLYATPWGNEYPSEWYQKQKLKNGEQNNRYFLVIETRDDWYAVQACETSPGTSFIRARDIVRYLPYYQDKYIITWDTPLLDEGTRLQKQIIKRFTEGEIISYNGNYVLMSFNQGTENEYRGFVEKQYIAPIIN